MCNGFPVLYFAKTEKEAWHLPLYDGSLGFIYNIRNKLYGKANVFAYGKRFAKNNNQPDEPIKLDPIWDFNLAWIIHKTRHKSQSQNPNLKINPKF